MVLQVSNHFPHCYQYLKLGQFWVKHADFEFEIVNCMINVMILILKLSISILNDDVPRSTSYGVYIPQLIRFAITHLVLNSSF